jgi:CheY-like chemotaxis protein
VQVRCDGLFDDGVRLHFSVSDTGIGILKDKQATIFDAFSQADGSTTRRFGGTGLGLTISSTLVQLMGGRIWVQSEPGQGSTFHFTATFPVADIPTRNYEPVLVGLPVLIVDDNEVNRRIFHEVLTRWEMKPVTVDSGPAAIAALADSSRRGDPFALVLLDANMPEMDGFAVAAQMSVHPEFGGATIMMLTSSGQFGDSTRCRELGIHAYLTKPIRHNDLFDAIRRTLRPLTPRAADLALTSSGHTLAVHARILLVEDNLVNQRVAVGLLTRRGHSVHVANNGIEALAALDSSPFDVVLMDIQMPEMGGIDATRAIRTREAPTGRHTRIVAMTAHAMKGDREQYLAAGMDGYLSKPVDPAALFAAVEQQSFTAPGGADTRLPETAPIAFDEMRRRLDDDDQLVGEVIDMFLVDCPLRLTEIKAAVTARAPEALRIAAHALVGAAGNMAAAPVVACARALETLGKAATLDAAMADAAWVRLEAEGERLMTALRAAAVQSHAKR